MWIRNKRTGKYECVSPAVGKHKINKQPSKFKDTQEKCCPKCHTQNHRYKENCRLCGEKL